MKITWRREALLYDVANLCWVMSETGRSASEIGERSALRELADCCKVGNVDRISRIFLREMAAIEVASGVKDTSCKVYDNVLRTEDFTLDFPTLDLAVGKRVETAVHDLLVTSAVADWLCVTLGSSKCLHWEELRDKQRSNALKVVELASRRVARSLKNGTMGSSGSASYGVRRSYPF